MRKQDRMIIWPTYFDAGKTRKEGRRVPKSLAIPMPRASEIEEASAKTGLNPEIVADVTYPKTPWLKTGMVLVKKKQSKEHTIKEIAKQLLRIRATQTTKQGPNV